MSTHTPGPWDMDIRFREFIPINQGGGEKITVWSGQGETRKRIGTITRHSELSETKANARLIASAPELLRAAKRARIELRAMHSHFYPSCKGDCPADDIETQLVAVIHNAEDGGGK